MLLIRFYHGLNKLTCEGKEYIATCDIRNELNGRRKPNQIVKTYPANNKAPRNPYMPRKFPTGLWMVKAPVWTDDIDYWPVKIPTTAKRNVLTWDVSGSEYKTLSHRFQVDAFYHLHFAKNSKTTLGCIRLDSSDDATEIAKTIEWYQKQNQDVYIEVLIDET